jgi:hypothetical protein
MARFAALQSQTIRGAVFASRKQMILSQHRQDNDASVGSRNVWNSCHSPKDPTSPRQPASCSTKCFPLSSNSSATAFESGFVLGCVMPVPKERASAGLREHNSVPRTANRLRRRNDVGRPASASSQRDSILPLGPYSSVCSRTKRCSRPVLQLIDSSIGEEAILSRSKPFALIQVPSVPFIPTHMRGGGPN